MSPGNVSKFVITFHESHWEEMGLTGSLFCFNKMSSSFPIDSAGEKNTSSKNIHILHTQAVINKTENAFALIGYISNYLIN